MKKLVLRVAAAVGALSVLLFVFLAVLTFRGAGRARYPSWMSKYRKLADNPKHAYGYAYDSISFPAEDGETLRGWFVAGRSGAAVGVVTVHGAGGNREEFMPELKMLHEAGYPVLMFDCREQGESDGRGSGISLGVREHRDVESAVRYAKEKYALETVVVLGCSQGAASAILAAAEDHDINGVVEEASFVEPQEVLAFAIGRVRPDLSPRFVRLISNLAVWRMGGSGLPGPVDAIGDIAPRPILVMQGSADTEVPPHDVTLLYQHAREPKSIWIGEGAGHCELRERYPDQYRQHLMGFLGQYFPIDP